MKILAVDDEPLILELLPLLAARVGFPHVEIASSGEEALRLLAHANPAFDCLIFDISMPEIDGIELCRLVREMKPYRQTPIIILTAMNDRKFVDQAFQAGATDYATKPIDLMEIGARLRLANSLMTARREAEELRTGSARLNDKKMGLEDKVDILGVPKLTDVASLKNYLNQLSITGASASQITAFRIARVKELYNKATPDEFHYALSEFASAISSIMGPSIALMSYVGSGTYLVVSSAGTLLDSEQIESDIQYFLDERNLEYDNGTPMNFEICMGSALRPISGDLEEIERSIDRAVARVTAREQTRQNMPMRPSIR